MYVYVCMVDSRLGQSVVLYKYVLCNKSLWMGKCEYVFN